MYVVQIIQLNTEVFYYTNSLHGMASCVGLVTLFIEQIRDCFDILRYCNFEWHLLSFDSQLSVFTHNYLS